ncbi:MAG: Rha family transcriptional regulator [Defluviitaleaceae bacterium]|nr:Rha family transcriptional regulator [Defluviitaleaceae bacterium]
MYNLTIIKEQGRAYIESREVAAAMGKRHSDLLRDIRGYIEVMDKPGVSKIAHSYFFLESAYLSAQNKWIPCYLLSKMGCEMVANKLTGEKGILFTAAYVAKFNTMETAERAALEAELEALAAMPAPRLGEFNACARIIVRALRDMGATAQQVICFLKGVYEPLGITVAEEDAFERIPQVYTAKQIAQRLGIFSLNGHPHYQAVACILNENIFIGDDHKIVETGDYGSHIGVYVRYDEYAVQSVMDWLHEHEYPDEVYGFERTYHVIYGAPLSSRGFV